MSKQQQFEETREELERVTRVAKHYREDVDEWASLSDVDGVIEYLTHWLETQDIDREERAKMANVILFLKGDKDDMPCNEKPHERIPDDLQENLETLHGAMTIHTAQLWAAQRDELRPEDDNMYY